MLSEDISNNIPIRQCVAIFVTNKRNMKDSHDSNAYSASNHRKRLDVNGRI